MTTNLPANPGFLPKKPGGLDSKTRRLVLAMVVGIDTPLEDAVCGIIPAFKPLSIREACRAVGMKTRRGRDLQGTAEFQSALREATEQVRIAEVPKNVAVAISLRDDPARRCTGQRRAQRDARLHNRLIGQARDRGHDRSRRRRTRHPRVTSGARQHRQYRT